MSIAQDTFRSLAGLVGFALKTFALTALAVAVGYGALLATAAYHVAAHGSLIRGLLAAGLSLTASTILAGFVAVQLTVVRTIQRAIQQAAVGSKVFNGLFDIMLGINEENPAGNSGLTQALHGISREELQQKLTSAGEQYLRYERIETALPRLARWLLRKMQSMIVWTVVKVVMLQCALISEGPEINLLEVRDKLAGVIDEKIADYLRANTRRTLLGIGFAVTAGVLLLAWGIGFIPVSLEEAGLSD